MHHTKRFHSCFPRTVALGLLVAASAGLARSAHADLVKTHVAVDFDFVSALDDSDTKSGGGGAVRVGEKVSLVLVSLTPEIGGSYHAFGGDDKTKIFAGFVGARLGFGKLIEPSLFAHIGVGHASQLDMGRTAPMLDGGLALDFTLLPVLDLGVHGAYNVMLPSDNSDALKFITAGAQVALVF